MTGSSNTPGDDGRLERELGRALPPADADGLPPVDPDAAMDAAFGTYRARRRMRVVTGLSAIVFVVGLGAFLYVQTREDAGPGVDKSDPVAYALYLYRRVFPGQGGVETDRSVLTDDPDARAEYMAALDHASSFVRRTALTCITHSGVALTGPKLARFLTEYREDLQLPIEVAAVGDHGAVLAEALERRRNDTIYVVLGSVWRLASRNQLELDPAVLLSHLSHGEARIRERVVLALGALPDFEPGEEIRALLTSDPSPAVRMQAAQLLLNRGGTEAQRTVIEALRTMDMEAAELKVLTVMPLSSELVGLARGKLAVPDMAPKLRLAYARILAKAGDSSAADRLIPAALESDDADIVVAAGTLCMELDRINHRDALKRAHDRLPAGDRQGVIRVLVRWDLESRSPARMLEAVRLARKEDARFLRRFFEQHRETENQAVRQAIQSLLAEWEND